MENIEINHTPEGLQFIVLSNLREALVNASLHYCSCKQFGEAEDIASAWSLYVRVRDLYEEIMQNIIV